jgi:hypothetical protein
MRLGLKISSIADVTPVPQTGAVAKRGVFDFLMNFPRKSSGSAVLQVNRLGEKWVCTFRVE